MNLRIESHKGYMIVGNAWECLAIQDNDPIQTPPNSKHFWSSNGFAFSLAFDWVAQETADIVA